MLSPEEIAAYLEPLNPDQAENIRAVRALLRECSPTLVEEIRGDLINYNTPDGTFAYAVGPRAGGRTTFHMMPYYGSPVLQERHGATLKPFLSGKSCLLFKRYAQLPETALRDILSNAPNILKEMQALQERRKK